MRFSQKRVASLCAVAVSLVFAGSALADSTTIDFESYTLGSIDGQQGWSSTGPYDQEVVAGVDNQSLRISNAITSGAFGDQTFSPSLNDPAGETGKSYFEASWEFASATGEFQSGLSVVASPDRGDGARMSWIQMADTPTGLAVNFYDYQDALDPGCATGDGFVLTPLAGGLARNVSHTIKVRMFFVPGAANDVVQVLVDGTLRHTGTSWEDYFRDCEGNPTRNVDSILFRTGGAAAPDTLHKGFLIDNLSLVSSNATVAGGCAFDVSSGTWKLLADCTTDETIHVPSLDGDGHTITAVDPAGGHFLGAVVKNGGTVANVKDVTITASGLDDICDGADNRLRGILLDGASGSITNVTVHGVRQGMSGCQEGNAIEVRNIAGTSRLGVIVIGNTVFDYMKNGITANGNVLATIQGNTVTGDGNVSYIAQNGIQVGFGASATIEENTVSGNWYTAPAGQPEFDACGLLFFEAAGVKQRANTLFANEKNVCNFGRGGGKTVPAGS